jgi:ubiquinone/menaquinone biosynthesis C-methylase UbiE
MRGKKRAIRLVNPEAERDGTITLERVAPVYDSTRRMSDETCSEITREIVEEAGNREGLLIGDLGAGTGRFSIPLVMRGCRVIGVDISLGMIRVMLSKIRSDSRLRLQAVVADVRNLPFRSHVLDVALCFQVLHLVPDWHSVIADVHRTLVEGGLFSVGESLRMGISAEVNDEYGEIRTKQGFEHRRAGAQDIDEVISYLRSTGCLVPEEPEKHSWVGRMTVNSIIQGLADRVYSGTWSVPDDTHIEIIQELRDWANKRYNDLEISREVSSEVKLAFVRFPPTPSAE